MIAGTALACVATYEVVRRINWLRPLFGLRMENPIAQSDCAATQPA